MTSAQAIEEARKCARAHGYDIAKYNATAVKKEHQWLVEFRSRDSKPRPGDFFSVYVDEQSPSAMRLVPGK